MEPDGIRSGEYFLDEFYSALKKGKSIRDSFNTANANTATFTRRGGIVSSIGDKPLQNPLISVNGAAGTTWLPTGFDDNSPETLYLGSGDDTTFNPGTMLPKDRTAKVEAIFLTNKMTSATISTGGTADQKAWFEVRAPSNKLVQTGGSNQLDVVLPRTDMTWDASSASWSAANSSFIEFGSYDITIYQQEVSGDIAHKQITLYRNRPANLDPTAVTPVAPVANAVVQSTLMPSWSLATDPDNDMISYTLLISINGDMSNPVLVKEGLTTSYAIINYDDGLQDLSTYYWQIWTIDSYGSLAKSVVSSFKTDNTNGLPGVVKGNVRDATGNPIPNVTITITGNKPVVSLSDGSYAQMLPVGSYTLSSAVTGYQSKNVNLTVTAGVPTNNDFTLLPVVQVVRSITTTISGLGQGYLDCPATTADGTTVNCQILPGAGNKLRSISGCGGTQSGNQFSAKVTADCMITAAFNSLIQYGDCDNDGQVTIAEVQSGINTFLGLKPVAACIDSDGSGNVSISEVQKAINSFLGL